MVVPLLIYTGAFRRAAAVLWLAAGCYTKGCPPVETRAASKASSRAGSLRVYALLLADHRLCLLGSPWFDPDVKPRAWMKASVSLFASLRARRVNRTQLLVTAHRTSRGDRQQVLIRNKHAGHPCGAAEEPHKTAP